jgi:hypothetical protein
MYTNSSGAATLASLSFPCAVTVDSEGNLYIADSTNTVIRRVQGPIVPGPVVQGPPIAPGPILN